MAAKLDNARALYMEGILQGYAREAVEAYTGDRYTQHSTGVRDGVEGFVEFFEPFIERNPVRDIQIIRGFEDGNFVFLHAAQSLNDGESRWITMDMFDTDDNDKILEHWDVITEWRDESAPGRSQIDGETDVGDLERTDENKAIVAAYVEAVLMDGRTDEIADFVSAEGFVQHAPQMGDGIDGLTADLARLTAAGTPLVYKYVRKILGQGNFVVTYCLVQLGDDDMAVFDLYRLDGGKIVEHWDAVEPLPRGDALVNRGKF